MAAKKTIVVIGATGAQGGGLARAILADPASEFAPRAVTRHVDSDKAKALAALGMEVVAADADAPDTLTPAFAGADAAFLVTNFWEHFSGERELAQAKALAAAAKTAGIRHVVWSTLEDSRRCIPLSDNRMPTLQGRFKVPHFDAKAEADGFFREIGVPTTFLLTSFYWDNLIYFGLGPKRGPDGKLAMVYPMDDARLPGIAAEDIGKCAYGVFERGAELIGKTIGIAGGLLTGAEMAASLSRGLGQEIGYRSVPPDVYRGFGFPAAEEIGNMFQFKRDCNEAYCAARDIGLSRTLNPDLQSFDTWVSRNKERIPLE